MFALYQEKLILFAYGRKGYCFMSKDIRDIYTNIFSFYRSMKILLGKGVFRKERSSENNRNTFYLTEKGFKVAGLLKELEGD